MLQVGHGTVAGGTAISRRHLLQVGGIGALGLTLADWWRAKEVAATPSASAQSGQVLYLPVSERRTEPSGNLRSQTQCSRQRSRPLWNDPDQRARHPHQ